MRIGIDYLPAVTHFPGVGRYARELVRAMVRLPGAPELLLLDAGAQKRTVGEPHLGLAGVPASPRRVIRRLPRRTLALWSRVTGRGADVWLGGVDLFHRIHPLWPPVTDAPQLQPVGELPPAGTELDEALGRTLARFEHWLVMSGHGARELERRYGFDPARIHRVPIGSDQWRRALPDPPPRADPPLVIALGALQRRRRPRTVLAAFESACASFPAALGRARLVFAGGGGDERGPLERKMLESPARERVAWRPNAREDELAKLVATASALVHLTEGEESAVTPLEAFSFGTPVVATDLGAFAEAVGAEARLVGNAEADADPAALGRAIVDAVESAADPAARARREAIAREHTWERNAAETLEVYAAIVGRGAG